LSLATTGASAAIKADITMYSNVSIIRCIVRRKLLSMPALAQDVINALKPKHFNKRPLFRQIDPFFWQTIYRLAIGGSHCQPILAPLLAFCFPARYTAGFGNESQARSSSILTNRKPSGEFHETQSTLVYCG
jgi:hypothetical protein